ncbi:MAG: ketopantoate reductase family protein [Promethearchaeota archaeon]
MEIKKIWVCGIGGVGGYFGGRLVYEIQKQSAKDVNVYFLARGDHLKEIKHKGLELHTSDGKQITCNPTIASDNVKAFPHPDICFICVKNYDLNGLIDIIENKLSLETIIIPLMNGIDIYDRIRIKLKKCIVFPTCVYVGSHIERSGLVIQNGNEGFFCCGPDPIHPEFNPNNLISFFKKIKINMQWKDDPYPIIWEKYLLVASFALVCTYTGQAFGGVLDDPKNTNLLKDVMREIVTIAEKKGIILPSNIIEKTIIFCKDYPDIKPSYMRDVEKGRKNEGDLFGGAIIRMGQELGVPTPVTESIYKKRS